MKQWVWPGRVRNRETAHAKQQEKCKVTARWACRRRKWSGNTYINRQLLTSKGAAAEEESVVGCKGKIREWGTEGIKDTARMYVCMHIYVCVRDRVCAVWSVGCMAEQFLSSWLVVRVCTVGGPRESFDHYRVWQKSSDREVTPPTTTHTPSPPPQPNTHTRTSNITMTTNGIPIHGQRQRWSRGWTLSQFIISLNVCSDNVCTILTWRKM